MCSFCGMTTEEISERGIPRLRHRLGISLDKDFWTLLAAEKYDIEPDEVSQDQRNETKLQVMRVLSNV